MFKIKFLYRKLLGKCIFCGKKREKHNKCIHCINPKLCHFCMKAWAHGQGYGMSKESLMRELEK